MGSKRVGLARTQVLIENLKRELDLAGSAIQVKSVTVDDGDVVLNSGLLQFTQGTATTYAANSGSIPITHGLANIDAGGSARTHLKFAGAGTAGQMLLVMNTGGEKLTFDNTEGTSLLRGINGDHDTMAANFMGLFVSDGSRWNLIAGGVDTQPDVGLLAS